MTFSSGQILGDRPTALGGFQEHSRTYYYRLSATLMSCVTVVSLRHVQRHFGYFLVLKAVECVKDILLTWIGFSTLL